MIEARFYERLNDTIVQCHLCHHHCRLLAGEVGFCRSKRNDGGTLFAIQYGQYTSIALDPVEKKPLYHFYPGRLIVSIGNNSCNLTCGFCQNWQISQQRSHTSLITPEHLAALAGDDTSIGVAYTYAEPLMWYEFVVDAATEVRKRGFKNVLVTNGSINSAPLNALLPLIDAMNIDVKSIRADFYHKVCSGSLELTQNSVSAARNQGVHVEITNLVIPTLNDSEEDIRDLAQWVASVDPYIPVHFSRYYPQYQFDTPSTPIATLIRCREIARDYLKFVYVGNVRHEDLNSTYCEQCGALAIQRDGSVYSVSIHYASGGKCVQCGAVLHVIG